MRYGVKEIDMGSGQDLPRSNPVEERYESARRWLSLQQDMMQDNNVVFLDDLRSVHGIYQLFGLRPARKMILLAGPHPDLATEIFFGSWHLWAYRYIKGFTKYAQEDSCRILIPRMRAGGDMEPLDLFQDAIEAMVEAMYAHATHVLKWNSVGDTDLKRRTPQLLRFLSEDGPRIFQASDNVHHSMESELRFASLKRTCADLFGIELPEDNNIPF